MAANNKKQMVFSYDNSINVNSRQRLPAMSAWQPLVKFIYRIVA